MTMGTDAVAELLRGGVNTVVNVYSTWTPRPLDHGTAPVHLAPHELGRNRIVTSANVLHQIRKFGPRSLPEKLTSPKWVTSAHTVSC